MNKGAIDVVSDIDSTFFRISSSLGPTDVVQSSFCIIQWDEDLEESIFDYIRESQAFAYAKNEAYIQIKIFMDET